MKSTKRTLSFLFILLLAVLACSTSTPVAVPTQSIQIDLDTIVAQTAAAAMTQTALVGPSSSETFTPEIPFTVTNTATETPTATLFFTATMEVPMISVSISTNCRSGPGKVYDYRSALLVGVTAEIFAREATGKYWYIRDPEAADEQYCWVWGEYATIVGNTNILPIYTPPPTPTATMTPVVTNTPVNTATKKTPAGSFVVSYNNTDTCSPNWWTDFRLRNNGSISFDSFKISIKDMSNGAAVFEKSSNVFTDLAGCSTLSEKDTLDPADILLFSGPAFSYDPAGHKLRILLILCTGNNQKGTCMKQNFDVQL
ncbi:MAG: hypothetical protein K8S20_14625 [Chloroflexi bacterium]|nr:hypothetical protein [Chloroflexota bacterium]